MQRAVAQQSQTMTDGSAVSLYRATETTPSIRREVRALAGLELKKYEERARIKVSQLVNDYSGASTSPTDTVIIECVKTIFKRFAHITANELTTAMQMAAAGELQENGKIIEATAYKAFSVDKLGRILRAYDAYRAEAIRQGKVEVEKEEREREMERLRQMEQESRLKTLREFDEAVATGIKYTLETIPLAWVHSTIIEEERLQTDYHLWEQALQYANEQLKCETLNPDMAIRIAARAELDGKGNGRKRAIAINRYKRLSIIKHFNQNAPA